MSPTRAYCQPTLNNVSQVTHYLLGTPSVQGGVNLSYTPVIRSMAYDSRGNMTNLTDPTGYVSQTAYNSLGQLSAVTLPAKAGASSVPVITAGTAASIAPSARTFTLGYNPGGDLSLITDATGNETRMASDAIGRPTGSTDPLGYSSSLQYNAINQPLVATNPLGQTSRLSYDSAGRVTGVVNPAGVTIESYTYDSTGRLTRKTDALGQSDSVDYDSSNRPIKVTDRKGQVTTISYTQRGQIDSVSSPDRTVAYQYDALGRVTEVRDASSVNSYQYDAADRIIQTDNTTAAGSHRLQYSYDSLDRVTVRTLSGSGMTAPETTSYSWDAAGRLLGHTTTFAVSAAGTGVAGAASQPNHATQYRYDTAGRLAERTSLSALESSPSTATATVPTALAQRYAYDNLERLSRIQYINNPGQSGEQLLEQIDYSYDANGRRTSKTTLNNNGTGQGETPMSANYDVANRMTSISLNIAGSTQTYNLSYDAAGNLTNKQHASNAGDATTYRWDASNRLTQITQAQAGTRPALNASYTYDAFGRRIQATLQVGTGQSQTVQYLYEGAQALGEIRNGNLSHRLLTGLSLDSTIARIAMTNGLPNAQGSRNLLTDALDTVISQLNADGNATANSYAYSPYGESNTVGVDATNNPNQFTGRENDSTGLIYYRARYYDPVIKRFISQDPAGLSAGANLYMYVGGDPVNMVDPSGMTDVYRGPGGNSFSDIPPPGCHKAVWRGGYIVGWTPCDPPPRPPCPPGAGGPGVEVVQGRGLVGHLRVGVHRVEGRQEEHPRVERLLVAVGTHLPSHLALAVLLLVSPDHLAAPQMEVGKEIQLRMSLQRTLVAE